MWPYRILGLDQDGTVAAAHAAHKSLCARLGDSAMDRARRGRYDAALAWCVEHWLDGTAASVSPTREPASRPRTKPRTNPEGGRARSAGTASASRTPSAPAAPPIALTAPPSVLRSALELLAIRRARAAYKAAQEALRGQPEVRTWRA